MMKIAVCEDEPMELEKLKKRIYEVEQTSDISVECYSCATQLKEALLQTSENFYDLLLLDIEMEDYTGMQLAIDLRKSGCNSTIVFVTASRSYAIEGYQVQAYRYLLKPVGNQQLKEVIEYAKDKQKEQQKSIVLQNKNEVYCVRYQDLYYLEMYGHEMVLHKRDGNLKLRMSLRSVQEQLDASFFRIHKSYVINFAFVSQFDGTSVTMVQGDILPLSRNYAQEFRQKIAGYWGGRINE